MKFPKRRASANRVRHLSERNKSSKARLQCDKCLCNAVLATPRLKERRKMRSRASLRGTAAICRTERSTSRSPEFGPWCAVTSVRSACVGQTCNQPSTSSSPTLRAKKSRLSSATQSLSRGMGDLLNVIANCCARLVSRRHAPTPRPDPGVPAPPCAESRFASACELLLPAPPNTERRSCSASSFNGVPSKSSKTVPCTDLSGFQRSRRAGKGVVPWLPSPQAPDACDGCALPRGGALPEGGSLPRRGPLQGGGPLPRGGPLPGLPFRGGGALPGGALPGGDALPFGGGALPFGGGALPFGGGALPCGGDALLSVSPQSAFSAVDNAGPSKDGSASGVSNSVAPLKVPRQ
mmetsp:Transcript_10684/g.22501  ORF Transcript_10684/g.22501 Transcript_10684/m.22501 type:complete len:350 (+) Transcript_10684:2690-3739(+)